MIGGSGGGKGMPDKESLARALWASGALKLSPAGDLPAWDGEAALGNEALCRDLLDALEEMARDHYASAQAVLGGPWAELLAKRLGLPLNPSPLPDRPLAVADAVLDGVSLHTLLAPIRESGASVAAAALFNYGLESARRRLDRADVRLHWLTDLETALAVALQDGRLDFEEYDRLMAKMDDETQ